MAGVGEASAIIGVAVLGFSLAKTLNGLVGDYKDARRTLTRMGAEIESTSLAMERLGDLAKQGRLYGDKGVLEAAGLASRYSDAIADIRAMLKKKNNPIDPNLVKPDEIELSSFQKLQFAFLKPRLEISQLEVSRIKADLTLTYLSMIALTGDTDAEKKQAAAEIPAWTRTLRWANLEYEKAVSRQRNSRRTPDSALHTSMPTRAHSTYGVKTRGASVRKHSLIPDDVNAEHLKQYIEWAQREQANAERKAEELRFEMLRLEQQKKHAEDAAKEQAIADRVIKEYEEKRRVEAAELARQEKARDDEFRQRLQDAHVPDEEINRILSNAPLMLTGPDRDAGLATVLSNPRATGPIASIAQNGGTLNSAQPQAPSKIPKLTHRYSQIPSLPVRHNSKSSTKPLTERPFLEAWCIDHGSQSRFPTPLNEDWLDDFVASKAYKKASRDMWARYAQLHLWYRKQINEVFEEKLRDRKFKWSMISLQQTRPAKARFDLRRGTKDSLVQLILIRLPEQSGQKYTTWFDDAADILPLPLPPSAGPTDLKRGGSERSLQVESLDDTETRVNSSSDYHRAKEDGADRGRPQRDPRGSSPNVFVDILQLGDQTITLLPANKIDGTALESYGYKFIESGSDYVVMQALEEAQLDSLIDQKYQTIVVVTYRQDFQTMTISDRAAARDSINQFVEHDSRKFAGRFLHLVYRLEITSTGRTGVVDLADTNPYRSGQHSLPFTNHGANITLVEPGILHGEEASASQSRRLRFANEVTESGPYRSQDDRLDDSDLEFIRPRPPGPVRGSRSHGDIRISFPSRRASHLHRTTYADNRNAASPFLNHETLHPRSHHASYSAGYYPGADDFIPHRNNFRRDDWNVVRQSGPPSRMPYEDEFLANQHDFGYPRPPNPYQDDYPYPADQHNTHVRRDGIPRRGNLHSRLPPSEDHIRRSAERVGARHQRRGRSPPDFLYGDNRATRRRPRSPAGEESYGRVPNYGRDAKDYTSEDSFKEGFRSSSTGIRIYERNTRIGRGRRASASSSSDASSVEDYIPLRNPRPYEYTDLGRVGGESADPGPQNDQDITDMQLAKYTGGALSTAVAMGTTSNGASTENTRPKMSIQGPIVPVFRSRATYVEDTVDDDDDRSFHGRIFEIHEEPESFTTAKRAARTNGKVGEESTAGTAFGWNFGGIAMPFKGQNHYGDAAPAAKETETAVEDDWAAWGTRKKGKKKIKKGAAQRATSKWNDGAAKPASGSGQGDGGAQDWSWNTKSRSKPEDGQNSNTADQKRDSGGKKEDEPDKDNEKNNNNLVGPEDDEKNWSWNSNQEEWNSWEKRRGGGIVNYDSDD